MDCICFWFSIFCRNNSYTCKNWNKKYRFKFSNGNKNNSHINIFLANGVFVGSFNTISLLTPKTIIFLILSGLSTGLSWLCYFKALQLGNVNKVTPIDKSSTILTMILAMIFLNEQNLTAKGFYEHLGFKSYKRSEIDEQGNHYPILYMKLER